MRLTILFLTAIICGSIAGPSASMASGSAWCAHYGFDIGATNCGFASYAQCMAALSGNGGSCPQNSQYQPPVEPSSPHRHRSSS
jgi:hypothetical protein